jgi:hypothetical protein
MTATEIKAELSIKMIELEQALDLGMPYPELKKIYNQIKLLQYQITLTPQEVNNRIGEEDIIIE